MEDMSIDHPLSWTFCNANFNENGMMAQKFMGRPYNNSLSSWFFHSHGVRSSVVASVVGFTDSGMSPNSEQLNNRNDHFQRLETFPLIHSCALWGRIFYGHQWRFSVGGFHCSMVTRQFSFQTVRVEQYWIWFASVEFSSELRRIHWSQLSWKHSVFYHRFLTCRYKLFCSLNFSLTSLPC